MVKRTAGTGARTGTGAGAGIGALPLPLPRAFCLFIQKKSRMGVKQKAENFILDNPNQQLIQ